MMKVFASLVASSALANAQYTFPAIIKDAVATIDCEYGKETRPFLCPLNSCCKENCRLTLRSAPMD